LLIALACVFITLSTAAALTARGQSPTPAPAAGPNLRFVHFSPGVAPLDVYMNGVLVVQGMAFKDASSYLPLSGYAFDIAFVPAGRPISEAITQPLALTFAEGDQAYYTIATVGAPQIATPATPGGSGGFEVVLLPADGPPPATP
jgi:hypothetical protein